MEQVVADAAGGVAERPRRRRVLDAGERDTDDEERQVGDGQIQQQDVGRAAAPRPARHDHRDDDQVSDDADDGDEREYDRRGDRPQRVVEPQLAGVVVVVVVVVRVVRVVQIARDVIRGGRTDVVP